MEAYRTEDEQVEALRRWWEENGRSTAIAIVVVIAGALGWQGWQANQKGSQEQASALYQQMVDAASTAEGGVSASAVQLGEQLKQDYKRSTYARFAALHLAALAVARQDLAEAEVQLRWVLGQAEAGSDIAMVAQLRLARVVAAAGDVEQALNLLQQEAGTYAGSYAIARGDILLSQDRMDEARAAYNEALALAAASGVQARLPALQQKLQSLNPAPPRELMLVEPAMPLESGDNASTSIQESDDEPAPAE